MARFDKIDVLAKMRITGIVPVFYHSNPEIAKQVVKACYDGGVRAFEFTNRGDFAHEVFAEVVKYAAKECPELAVGVGSVVDPATAALYLQLGACFVVGPLFNPEVARVCNRRSVPYTPGCGTVSEVGPKFVKGLTAPMPWSKLMVTGGVEPTRENISAWFAAGVYCVGMGSKLFPKDKIAAADWQYISDKCAEAIGYAAECRTK